MEMLKSRRSRIVLAEFVVLVPFIFVAERLITPVLAIVIAVIVAIAILLQLDFARDQRDWINPLLTEILGIALIVQMWYLPAASVIVRVVVAGAIGVLLLPNTLAIIIGVKKWRAGGPGAGEGK